MTNYKPNEPLVAQSEVTLESYDNMGDNNVGETPLKSQKEKNIKKWGHWKNYGGNLGCCFSRDILLRILDCFLFWTSTVIYCLAFEW